MKNLILRLFGIKSYGWTNVYLRVDGTRMTGGMLYRTKAEAKSKGLCQSAKSKYIGTKRFYYV